MGWIPADAAGSVVRTSAAFMTVNTDPTIGAVISPPPSPASTLFTRVVHGLLVLAGVVVALVVTWIAYTSHARVEREVRSAEDVSAGRGKWVGVGDAAVFFQEWGDSQAPTVLLVHGTGAWSGTWFGLPDALVKAGWHVVAVDLPPFGLSSVAVPTAEAFSRTSQAERVLAVIARLNRPVYLVGHSFGAGPALEAAMLSAQNGGLVRKLLLVDAALGLGPAGEAPHCADRHPKETWLDDRGVRTALVSATATWPGLTPTLLKRYVHRTEVVDAQSVPAYQVPLSRVEFSATVGDWALAYSRSACELAQSLRPTSVQEWSSAYAMPVSLIWGGQDTVTPPAQAKALQGWMPGASLTLLPGLGHIPHLEGPEVFARALLQQLPPLAQAQR